MAFLFERRAKIVVAVLLASQSIDHVSNRVLDIFAPAFIFEREEEKYGFVANDLQLAFGIGGSQERNWLFGGFGAVRVIVLEVRDNVVMS